LAGEHLPASVLEDWRKTTGITILDGIATTEMLHMVVATSDGDPPAGSTDRPVDGYRAMIVDEHMKAVPPNTIGRLAVKGPIACRYLDDPERQKAYVRNGWNLTGDAYRVDQDGYCWYLARVDDIIVSAGYNISGAEVESVMLEHPAVKELAVVGVADENRGMIVMAFIVLKDPTTAGEGLVKELQDFVKAQIAPYRYPRGDRDHRDPAPHRNWLGAALPSRASRLNGFGSTKVIGPAVRLTPPTIERPAPMVGEHTEEILHEFDVTRRRSPILRHGRSSS